MSKERKTGRCLSPFFQKDLKILVPCGKCTFCRISKRNKWSARLILEKQSHSEACFVTLTYSDENLPSPPSVSKRELQLFLKRLRRSIEPKKIRYFACGEYGDKKLRPHYHLIIFGLSKSEQTKDLVKSAWDKGHIVVDECVNASMRYVAGYVSKKYSSDKASKIGDELEKEFALMSRRPALGTEVLYKMVDVAFVQNPYDVLSVFRSGGRNYPLDRTMREKLRKLVMTPEEIEHIKELRIGLMQEELEELIKEELGLPALYDFKNSDRWRPECIAQDAYSSKNYENSAMLERIYHRRSSRKDL